ncbi:hypothetical protein [Microbacterium sp. ET2]|uniref:hypothetical protein n=1 Tax=Microbacterium albipurpureum TaxID=3050384 RepID=UPI002FDE91FA
MTTPPPAPFALARYREGDSVRLGLVAGDRIRPLGETELGAASVNGFLAAPDWSRLQKLAEQTDAAWRPLDEVTLTAPVEPRQVLQAGANYRTHVVQLIMAGLTKGGESELSPDEVRAKAEKIMDARAASGRPFIFLGLAQCVVGDDAPLELPSYSDTHDWELGSPW